MTSHVLQRHRGIVILAVVLFLAFVLLYLARNIVLPFLIGLVIAYTLTPVVKFLERRAPWPGKWTTFKRTVIIGAVFLALLLLVVTAGYYAISAIVSSVVSIAQSAPDFMDRALDTLQDWFSWVRSWLPAGAGQQMDGFADDLGANLGTAVKDIFGSIAVAIPNTISFAMGFATLPIFLFYLLRDHDSLGARLYSWLPATAARRLRAIARIIREVLGGYLRAQLVMAIFVGGLALIGLLVIGAPAAPGLAVVAGVTELVPILGPWIGGGIAVIVVLATDPSKVVWVALLFLAIQLVENTVLVPRIQAHYQHLHPAVAVVLIVVAAAVAGFWGLILVIPLASLLVRIYAYLTGEVRKEDMGLTGGDGGERLIPR